MAQANLLRWVRECCHAIVDSFFFLQELELRGVRFRSRDRHFRDRPRSYWRVVLCSCSSLSHKGWLNAIEKSVAIVTQTERQNLKCKSYIGSSATHEQLCDHITLLSCLTTKSTLSTNISSTFCAQKCAYAMCTNLLMFLKCRCKHKIECCEANSTTLFELLDPRPSL